MISSSVEANAYQRMKPYTRMRVVRFSGFIGSLVIPSYNGKAVDPCGGRLPYATMANGPRRVPVGRIQTLAVRTSYYP